MRLKRGAEVFIAYAEIQRERAAHAISVSNVSRVIALHEGAQLQRSLRQRAAGLVEEVGVEIVVDYSQNPAHAIGHRGWVGKLPTRVPGALLHVSYDLIVDIDARPD